MNTPTIAIIKARRVTGGAVVTVMRDGITRRHRVGLRRYNILRDVMASHRDRGCDFRRNGFEVWMGDITGLRETRIWAQTKGNPRGRHWQ
jgi:hypothetical protein